MADHTLTRDEYHLFFDPSEPPKIEIESGDRVMVETEDAHLGTIRDNETVYASLAEVFEVLGGANPVTGPIYVNGVEPGDLIAMTLTTLIETPQTCSLKFPTF